MGRKIKLKARKLNTSLLSISIILVLINTFFLVKTFTKNISPNINNIASKKIKELNNSLIINCLNNEEVYRDNFKDIMIVNTNDNNEIIAIDYKLDEVYDAIKKLNNTLKNEYNKIENSNINSKLLNESFFQSNTDRGLIMLIPSGYVFNSSLLANIGPDLPTKVLLIGNTFVNFNTKVSSYGLNNALVELYITIEINNSILFPNMVDDINTRVDFLITAKVIQGRVPSFYNGSYNSESAKISVPIS